MALTALLGTRKGVFKLEQSNGRFRVAERGHLGIPVPYAMRDARTGTMWASLDHGHWGQKLTRSKDDGKTWEEVEQPKYPEGHEVKPGVPATMRYIWMIAPGGAGEPDTLYLGTEPGGLFVSTNGGDTFELNEPLWAHPSRVEEWFGGGRDHPAVHSVLVDPRDSRRIQVGISCAGVFETTDGGTSWAVRNKGLRADFLPNPDSEVGQDPHLVVSCPKSPDTLWQQNHCGIYRSVDRGANWTDVSESNGPANFGFAVAVDEEDPDTAWVVPAVADETRIAVDGALCVPRTTDGGKTWTAFREGLPQDDCYDVVFRHALDVRGDTLLFGSTTGNLFASADRGESWHLVSSTFPPIYSVRFTD